MNGAAVLLGARRFWQGIDIPGDALQAVVIEKLPFEVPTELRKRRRSRINKLRKEIAEAEKKMHEYAEERDEINRHYLENPLDYSKEKQRRLEELIDSLTAL